MTATHEEDANSLWAWFWNERLWIVEGTTDASRLFAEELIASQHQTQPPDDYDTFVIAGELVERFVDAPG